MAANAPQVHRVSQASNCEIASKIKNRILADEEEDRVCLKG